MPARTAGNGRPNRWATPASRGLREVLSRLCAVPACHTRPAVIAPARRDTAHGRHAHAKHAPAGVKAWKPCDGTNPNRLAGLVRRTGSMRGKMSTELREPRL